MVANRSSFPFMVIVGPDGAGKSSITDGFVCALKSEGLPVNHLHFDPLESPPSTDRNTAPHGVPARGIASGLAVLVVRVTKYLRSAHSGPLNGSTAFAIQERGWLDQVVDPERYRTPKQLVALARTLRLIIRRPDMYVLCGGDAATIALRKGELSTSETRRQLNAWESLLHKGTRPLISIDTCTTSIAASTGIVREAAHDLLGRHPAPAGLHSVPLAPQRLKCVSTTGARVGVQSLWRPTGKQGRIASYFATNLIGRGRAVARLPFPLMTAFEELGIAGTDFAVIQSHGRRRWVCATVGVGGVGRYIKIEPSPGPKLRHEASILRTLAADPGLEFAVPVVDALIEVAGFDFLSLLPIPDGRTSNALEARSGLEIALMLRGSLSGRGITHGDLAPWNILSGQKTGLVDWEDSSLDFRPGVDLAHFLVRIGMLTKEVASDGVYSKANKTTRSLFLEYADVGGTPRSLVAEAVTNWAHHWNP